jgi:hypothetical protein
MSGFICIYIAACLYSIRINYAIVTGLDVRTGCRQTDGLDCSWFDSSPCFIHSCTPFQAKLKHSRNIS